MVNPFIIITILAGQMDTFFNPHSSANESSAAVNASNDLTRIPDIDYANHPAYGKLFGKPSLSRRITALRRLLPHLKAQAIRNLGQRPPQTALSVNGSQHSPVAEEIARCGVVGISLNADEMTKIRQGAEPHIAALEAKRAQIPADQQRIWADTSKPIPRQETPELYAYLHELLEKYGIFAAALSYLGQPVRITNVDVQINDPADAHWRQHFADIGLPDPATAYMHLDSIRRVKCLIYLNEVTESNGPFHYVPGTNKIRIGPIENIVRKANDTSRLDRCDRPTRELFWALPKMLQKKSEFGNDLLDSTPEVETLISRERRIASEDGNMIFFDNNGIHRGGMVLEGKRIILQVPLAAD